MVDVVIADITRQKMKGFWQIVVAAALDTSHEVIPFFLGLFVAMLVLVLHVKKPEGNDAKHEHDGQLNQKKRFPPQQIAAQQIHDQQCEVIWNFCETKSETNLCGILNIQYPSLRFFCSKGNLLKSIYVSYPTCLNGNDYYFKSIFEFLVLGMRK